MSSYIKVDATECAKLGLDLDNLAETMGTGASRAVNTVAKSVRQTSVKAVISQVRLKETYVDPKVEIVRDATPAKAEAVLQVIDEPVLLDRFGGQQQAIANVWTPAMYAEKFGSLNATRRPNPKAPKLPWTPRTGDSTRAIAPGAKAAGIKAGVSVSKAARKFSHVFLINMRRGKVNGAGPLGAVEHVRGTKELKAMYGPSVYQVVKGVWRDVESQVTDDLANAVFTEVEAEIEKELFKK